MNAIALALVALNKMIENEALNWKTRAIAYEMALSNIKNDFENIYEDWAKKLIKKRIDEANEYTKIRWRNERLNG